MMRSPAGPFTSKSGCRPWLYGKPGTGKTTTAICTLRRLEEKAPIKTIIINCWEKHTFYEILNEMICQLRILRAEQNRTSFKLEKLRLHMNDIPVVVLLDEIDQIRRGELSTILYNLTSMLNACLICISNSTQVLTELEERVQSRLNPYTIMFPSYSRKDPFEILVYRAERALADGTWSHAAVRPIARMAQGDARAAIRMLHRAAVVADHQRTGRITKATLRKNSLAAKETRRTCILNNLTQDHRMLYDIVKQERKVLSGNLWQMYLQHCDRIRRKPLAPGTFSDYANRLVQAGLLTSERARVKGKGRLFKPAA